MNINICLCGAQASYPHDETCPYPNYNGADPAKWDAARQQLKDELEWKRPPHTQSISDDDLCSECSFCLYNPGWWSECTMLEDDGDWPGVQDPYGYIFTCKHFKEAT